MKVGIIGAGASGMYSALLIKKKHPSWDVFVFEKESKVGRKLLATGNGHCNLLNAKLSPLSFNRRDIISSYLELYPYQKLLDTIHSFGIMTMEIGNAVYPLTYSAASFVHILEDSLKRLSVRLLLNTKVIDYQKNTQNVTIFTDNGDFCVDYLLISTGGESSPNLGSDGSLFPILEKHGYQISPLRPGLCPIVVKEKRFLGSLAGVRHVCSAFLLKNGKFLAKEDGEFIYKSDGLSGICIFNLESVILRDSGKDTFEIVLDLFPGMILKETLQSSYSTLAEHFLDAILPKELEKEAMRQFGKERVSKNDLALFEKTLHHFHYIFESPYPFKNSQVTIGGVSFEEVSFSLLSKKEPNVYFLGEALDMDGLCGGNNLSWALLSALIVSESL